MKARPLDQFPPQFHKLLRKIQAEGRVFLRLASSKEANTIKMDFYRYRDSLIAYAPDTWEAGLVKGVMVRKQDAALEFSIKAQWSAMKDIDAQLDGDSDGTTDEEAEALRKLDEDIMKGKL